MASVWPGLTEPSTQNHGDGNASFPGTFLQMSLFYVLKYCVCKKERTWLLLGMVEEQVYCGSKESINRDRDIRRVQSGHDQAELGRVYGVAVVGWPCTAAGRPEGADN